MATYTYLFSAPAGGSLVITTSNTASNIITKSGTSYSGFAITGITGTFNGATVTGLYGASGAYSQNPSGDGEFEDNALFTSNTLGDGGSVNGIDVDGIAFTASDGNIYNIYVASGKLVYDSSNAFTGIRVASTQPVTVQATTFPCFASGTRIRCAHGDSAVENLSVGDLVETASGALRPIKWLGHRKVKCPNHATPKDAYPIRIAAHAFGESRPSRDLYVSPGHAICVDVLGEVLIPAGALVNGSTIQQIEMDAVTYWHVELDSHDVILAENLPAESYIDCDNRAFFVEADHTALHAVPDMREAALGGFCRPLHMDGPVAEVVRDQLHARALALGWRLDAEDVLGGVWLEIDGARIVPVSEGLVARAILPATAREVHLRSTSAVPAWTTGKRDERRLGLGLVSLTIDDGLRCRREIACGDARLSDGFHVDEGSHRWTDGCARLPSELWDGCRDSFMLRLAFCAPAMPRWIAPPVDAAAERPRLTVVA